MCRQKKSWNFQFEKIYKQESELNELKIRSILMNKNHHTISSMLSNSIFNEIFFPLFRKFDHFFSWKLFFSYFSHRKNFHFTWKNSKTTFSLTFRCKHLYSTMWDRERREENLFFIHNHKKTHEKLAWDFLLNFFIFIFNMEESVQFLTFLHVHIFSNIIIVIIIMNFIHRRTYAHMNIHN